MVVFFAVGALVSFVAWHYFWAFRSIKERPVLSSGMAEKMGNAFADGDTEDTSDINGGWFRNSETWNSALHNTEIVLYDYVQLSVSALVQ